jgi:hypothetical protein
LTVLVSASWLGCAGVKGNKSTGAGGSGGIGMPMPPPIPDLMSLAVTPPSQTVDLGVDSNGNIASTTATFQAIGTFNDGSTMDVSGKVTWTNNYPGSLTIQSGMVTVSAPGVYSIVVKSGSITAMAQLTARFQGSFAGDGFNPSSMGSLDGTPASGAAGVAQIAYPLDGSLFPANLGPIYVQITKPTASATSARLSFTQGDVLNVNWYAQCETDATYLPGTGCYVKLPLSFTQIFHGASDADDIQLVARVGGTGAPAESPPIKVAWSSVSLTGGLYYWTTICNAMNASLCGQSGSIYPNYKLPLNATSGTAVQRYDFDTTTALATQPQCHAGEPCPQLVYTDQGEPPAFAGSPYARASDGGQGTCVGCHSITTDGKFMALSINGSDAAGMSLLDITNKTLIPVSTTTTPPLQRFVREFCNGDPTLDCGAETSFGPTGPAGELPVMINMYKSKLYLRSTDFMSMIMNNAEVVPSTGDPYRTDPFWSQDGMMFAFTGFSTPSMGLYNTTGLNGDEKIGGQIWVASAERTAVHDDAKVVVGRQSGVTNYYPAISNDDMLLVYNQSSCGNGGTDPNRAATDYGNGPCDGYDDWTATLWMTTPTGGTQIRLDNANGTQPASNSWPRWSPDNGFFRGRRLYWIAFSSRRAYGLQVNYSVTPMNAKPQLWFTGILTGDEFQGDPSFAPVWLPNQNPVPTTPNGNHVPQWVAVAVPIPQ